MRPLDFLNAAADLVNASQRRPRQANLLRAQSTIYYALFHTLAPSNADTLIGGAGANRSKLAWRQAYRALEHGFAGNALRQSAIMSRFPQEIQDFADQFALMQSRRHLADYDPYTRIAKSVVETNLNTAKRIIEEFKRASLKDRRAFAAFVLLKRRA